MKERGYAVALGAVALWCGGCGGPDSDERERAIAAARDMYRSANASGVDMARGPCLGTIEEMPEWVVDVAHDPRQPVDDEAANQCEAYRSGDAEHFVELDPEGNLIRTG